MRFALALALLSLAGCGTFLSFVEGPRPFGGIETTGRKIGETFSVFGPFTNSCQGMLFMLDYVPSFALDVATLPITVWFWLFRKDE